MKDRQSLICIFDKLQSKREHCRERIDDDMLLLHFISYYLCYVRGLIYMLCWFWSNSNQNKARKKIELKNLSFYSVKPAGADQENLSPIAGVI